MSDRRLTAVAVLAAGLGLFAPGPAGAQAARREGAPSREMVAKRLERMKARYEKMAPVMKHRLSSAALAHFEFAKNNWTQADRIYDQTLRRGGRTPGIDAGSQVVGAGKVNDAKTDLNYSSLAGFTQSETTTAWCSPNALVAFNDSGSYFESYFQSFSGYSRSTNNGGSFTDMGYLDPGDTYFSAVSGDPVLGCSDSKTFYNAQLWSYYYGAYYGISVSKSTNGGVTFTTPGSLGADGIASVKSGTHFLDKEWMAVVPDPGGDNTLDTIYVTYTDFDTTGTPCGTTSSGLKIAKTGIEIVKSTDGGATFSAPNKVTVPGCPSDDSAGIEGVQGSQVAVNNAGDVFVAWNHTSCDLVPSTCEEQNIAKFTGGTLADYPSATSAAQIFSWGSGSGGAQTRFRINDFPTLVIDKTTGIAGKSDNLYMAWSGNTIGPFIVLAWAPYFFGDVEFTRSTDGGGTWSPITLINTNIEPFPSTSPLADRGSDQFFPAMAVDKAGAIGVCWYDRRKDPANYKLGRYCGKSTSAGLTWSNVSKSPKSWYATIDQDGFLNPGYMGDYDGLTTDVRKLAAGFLGAYSTNELREPDVKINKP